MADIEVVFMPDPAAEIDAVRASSVTGKDGRYRLRTGFRHSEYLSAAFKRELGVTPGEYRNRHRR